MIMYVFIIIHVDVEFGDILKWYMGWTLPPIQYQVLQLKKMAAPFPFLSFFSPFMYASYVFYI